MKYLILTVILSFILSISYSQNGIIRGKVTDKKTGEPIIGAVVSIAGTNPPVAVPTDFDGNYSLENLLTKEYSIVCSYISYKKQTIKNIKVEANKVQVADFKMITETQNISEIVVTADAIKNTENSLIAMQGNSITAINGVSAQSISKMGDSHAASAIKRVTGVSIEGGKYVFVRGLSDRYSKITLNGAEIPGLDPNKNTVQLDLFSTNIIDNIIVQKTFSPNLPASFAGGYVNISTKSFPTKFTLQFSTSIGYNPQTNLNSNFLSYEGGKTDFLGIDDGTRNIPENAKNEIPFLYENNSELDKITASFNKNMLPKQKLSFLNHSHSFSIGNQKKLFGKPIGFILDVNYSRNFSSYNDGIYSRFNLVSENNTSGVMNPIIIENENYGNEEIITSTLLGLSYKLTPFNKIGIMLMHNGAGLKTARHREGSKPEDNMYMFENTIGFQERALNSAQLNGSHAFGENKKSKIKWTTSLSKSTMNEPDLRFFNYDSVSTGHYNISYSAYPAPSRFYRYLAENNLDNKIHFSTPLSNATFKTGISYTMKTRSSVSNKFDILSQGLDFNGNVSDYLSDNNIGENAQNTTYGVYYQSDPITDKYNSYNAIEQIIGAYSMVEFKIGERTKIQTGIRYEYDYTFIQNLVEDYHPKYVRAEKEYYKDILPAININFAFTQSMKIRAAYSRTLGRPAFREIAPYAYYDFKEGWRVVGNPNLERTTIDNLDLRWEKFMGNGQLISVSAFAKYFLKPIELIDDPRANNPELHYVNAENSFLYGAEIELRKNFDFINLKEMIIGGNFTILKSQVKYIENYGATSALSVNRPMYGQSPWITNLFLSYDSKEKGISANMSFNVNGPMLAIVTKGDTPDVYTKPFPSLNFNISKTIFKKINLKLSVNNLLDAAKVKSYTYNDNEYYFQKYTLGRTFSFSVKYFIN